MKTSFGNKVALVTGASAGMGLATALAFAEAGAAVVLADVREEALNLETQKLLAAGHKAIAVRCNVAEVVRVVMQRKRPAALLGTLLAVLLAGSCSTPPSAPSTVTAIVGATLIDGTEAPPIQDSVILVDGGRIADAGPRSTVSIPSDAQIIDATGKTVMPGLIDMHAHYAPFGPDPDTVRQELAAQLAFGVTAARSPGLDQPETLAVFAEVERGIVPGPRVFPCGIGFTGYPDGVPSQIGADYLYMPQTSDEARQDVRELAAQPVRCLKIWVTSAETEGARIAPEILQAVVDEAERLDIPVVAHLESKSAFDELSALGINDFLHEVRDYEPGDSDFDQTAKSRGAAFTVTLNLIGGVHSLIENPEVIEGDAALQAVLGPKLVANLRDPDWRKEHLARWQANQTGQRLERAQRFALAMHQAGVPVFVGSDSITGGNPHGWSTHNEMRLLADAGIEPIEVIRMATGRAARQLEADDIGVIRTGAVADLIVLDADPLENIRNTLAISRVMHAGVWVDREPPFGVATAIEP